MSTAQKSSFFLDLDFFLEEQKADTTFESRNALESWLLDEFMEKRWIQHRYGRILKDMKTKLINLLVSSRKACWNTFLGHGKTYNLKDVRTETLKLQVTNVQPKEDSDATEWEEWKMYDNLISLFEDMEGRIVPLPTKAELEDMEREGKEMEAKKFTERADPDKVTKAKERRLDEMANGGPPSRNKEPKEQTLSRT